MTDVLFVTMDAGGNTPPLLGIAAEVQRRGHRVRVLGHEQQRASVEQAGLEFHPFRHGTPWDGTAPTSTWEGLRGLVPQFLETAKGTDVVELASPDTVVVIDALLVGAIRAAQRAGLTTVTLAHTFYAFFHGAFVRGPVGIAAKLTGRGHRRLWNASDAVLVATDPALDPASSRTWPESVVWTGPVQPSTPPASPVDPPRVLVSFSTTAFPGQREALQRVLDAVDGMPIDVVLTTGPAVDPADLTAPPNAQVHAFLPHGEVMPDCSAVVGHGGHSTMVRALAHGLPLVIMPMHPMLDQPMVGRVIEQVGAGVAIKRTASPQQIRAALETVLAGPHRTAAQEIGAGWRGNDGAAVAADRILALRQEPVSR